MTTVGWCLGAALQLYFLVLMVRALISWIVAASPSYRPRGAALVAFELVYTVTDPPLRWLRRFIKPLRLGLISLDLAFIVLIGLIGLLQRVIVLVFF